MFLSGKLGKILATEIKDHLDHKLTATYYGPKDDPVNWSIECETCSCVVMDTDESPIPFTS